MQEKQKYMQLALEQARIAYDKMEVPIGAVIVKDGEIISVGYNLTETMQDQTMHAEMIAIKKASDKLKSGRLIGCEMYVTCEPCTMCAGALILSRIQKVYVGTMDKKTGACGSVYNLLKNEDLNHQVEIETGILQEECSKLMSDFFRNLRKIKKQQKTEG